jgi:hypothetical protein
MSKDSWCCYIIITFGIEYLENAVTYYLWSISLWCNMVFVNEEFFKSLEFWHRQNDENTQYLMYILCIFVLYLYQQIPLRFFKFLRDIWLSIRDLYDITCLIVRNKCLHVGFVWCLVFSHSELNNHLLSYSYQIIVSIGNNSIFNAHSMKISSNCLK